MELIQTTIDIRKSGPITIRPVSDLQYGAEGVALEQFERYISDGVEQGSFFIGLGDFLDVESPSGRSKIAKAQFYDSVNKVLDDGVQAQLDIVQNILEPSRGKWLGLLEGHHFHQFGSDGLTVDERLCQFLEAEFLGNCALIRITFTNRKQEASIKIFVHHGTGSGSTVGSPVNKLERLAAYFDADLYLMAHHHKLVATPISRLIWYDSKSEGPKLKAKQVYMACTGGYLRGYTQGSEFNGRKSGSYVEQKLLAPTAIGGLVVHLTPTMDSDGYFHIEPKITL